MFEAARLVSVVPRASAERQDRCRRRVVAALRLASREHASRNFGEDAEREVLFRFAGLAISATAEAPPFVASSSDEQVQPVLVVELPIVLGGFAFSTWILVSGTWG
jgi:hypothetical protein